MLIVSVLLVSQLPPNVTIKFTAMTSYGHFGVQVQPDKPFHDSSEGECALAAKSLEV